MRPRSSGRGEHRSGDDRSADRGGRAISVVARAFDGVAMRVPVLTGSISTMAVFWPHVHEC